MKIVTILGARPQFIKASAISREISKYNDIEEIIIHTGQHFDKNMSDIFFEEMSIPKPDYNLDINSISQGAMTGRMIEEIEKILIKEIPDYVVIYGDTNSTIAGALAGKKLHIKIVHIEAGLRSFNNKMPEEINRILTDRISDYLFCPTDTAIKNLKQEGFDNFNCKVVKCGDVMQDVAIHYTDFAKKVDFDLSSDFILTTIHRAENTDNKERLKSIFEALNKIAKEYQIVLPLHPRTKKIIQTLEIDTKSLTIIEPVSYLEMVYLLKKCKLVMTDSGGLQKEAYFFRKLCITLRDETEWVELIENGFNKLVGVDYKNILDGFEEFKDKKSNFDMNLYGNGKASETIIRELLK